MAVATKALILSPMLMWLHLYSVQLRPLTLTRRMIHRAFLTFQIPMSYTRAFQPEYRLDNPAKPTMP